MIYVYMIIFSFLFMCTYDVLVNKKDFNSNTYVVNRSRHILGIIVLILSFLVIVIPGMIRYDVGIDYTTYSINQIPGVLNHQDIKVEPLYKAIIWIGYWIGRGTTYQYIFAITNFIIVYFIFLYIKNQSRYTALSILIFMCGGFFAFSLSGMRQSIAISIVLFSIKFIKEKKLVPFLIFIGVATLFHTAAIIFLVFYFLKNVRVNPLVILVLVIVTYFNAQSIRQILQVMANVTGRYGDYFGGQFDNGEYNKLLLLLVITVMAFVCGVYVFTDKDKFYKYSTELNLHYCACFVVSIASQLPTPSRLLFLFIPVYITLIPNMISIFKLGKVRFLLLIGTGTYFAFFMYGNIFIQNAYNILPYQDVFNYIH